MANMSEEELEYLQAGFDANSLTIPRLRQALMTHDIKFNMSAKKSELVEIFDAKLRPKAKRILSNRAKIKRTSMGIESVPSSENQSVEDEEEDELSDLHEPVATTRSRRTTRSTRASTAESHDQPTPRATQTRRTTSRTPAESISSSVEPESRRRTRISVDPWPSAEPEPMQSPVRASRRSAVPDSRPTTADTPQRVISTESPFSNDNPFQSGSSPLAEEEQRRTSAARKSDGLKSTTGRRKTQQSPVKQEKDDGVFTSSRTINIPTRTLRQSDIKQEPEDIIEAGEEFTPEEETALAAESDDRAVARPRKRKPTKKSSTLRTAPFAILLALGMAYGVWWRQEKFEVGFCGVGKPATTLQDMQVPEFLEFLQPQCEPCPPHAYCYSDMEAKCEKDFLLRSHPLSLGGLLPLVPTCEPDGEKVRRVKLVADRAVEELRERRAKFECGELTEADGKKATVVEIPEPSLKAAVSTIKRRSMSDEEFEDIWKGAIGEIQARDEVTTDMQGLSGTILLSSSSLARISYGCALRRSFWTALAEYKLYLGFIVGLVATMLWIRSYFRTLSNDKARVPGLVAMVLDRLATQAALHEQGSVPDQFMSLGQLRDDVLRDEFSVSRRDNIWKKVQDVVERNANVRASVREGRSGDVSRQWEWIGSTDSVDESKLFDRRRSGRYSMGPAIEYSPDGRSSPFKAEDVTQRRWDEGRPIY